MSASESGMLVATNKLTLPLAQSGEAEERADSPEWGLDIHWWNVGSGARRFAEK